MNFPWEWLVVAALGVFGLGLFQYPRPVYRKVGFFLLMALTGIGVTWLTGWWILGVIAACLWIAVPLVELSLFLKNLRLPRSIEWTDAELPAPAEEELDGLTREIETLGFVMVDACESNNANRRQYYRLFNHPEQKIYGLVGYTGIEEMDAGFCFVGFFSKEIDGRLWLTWNYPMPYVLQTPPELHLHRYRNAQDGKDLLQEHQALLATNEIGSELLAGDTQPTAPRQELAQATQAQLTFNLHCGILLDAEEPDECRYSWRGAAYVMRNFFLEFMRLR